MYFTGKPNPASVILTLSAAGDNYHTELIRALAAGLINIPYVSERTAILPRPKLRTSTLPVLALVGDDDYQSTGPTGWRCAKALIKWCDRAVVHATGGTPESCATAVAEAERLGRVALIESSNKCAKAWAVRCLPPRPVANLLPSDGQHPVTPSRRGMN